MCRTRGSFFPISNDHLVMGCNKCFNALPDGFQLFAENNPLTRYMLARPLTAAAAENENNDFPRPSSLCLLFHSAFGLLSGFHLGQNVKCHLSCNIIFTFSLDPLFSSSDFTDMYSAICSALMMLVTP